MIFFRKVVPTFRDHALITVAHQVDLLRSSWAPDAGMSTIAAGFG
jgi:hypothetical protein